MFRKVEDPETLERLESEPTIKVYHIMQEIDGKTLFSYSVKVEDNHTMSLAEGTLMDSGENKKALASAISGDESPFKVTDVTSSSGANMANKLNECTPQESHDYNFIDKRKTVSSTIRWTLARPFRASGMTQLLRRTLLIIKNKPSVRAAISSYCLLLNRRGWRPSQPYARRVFNNHNAVSRGTGTKALTPTSASGE